MWGEEEREEEEDQEAVFGNFLARFVPRGGRLRADQFVGPLLELVVAEKLDVISGREDVRGRGKISTPFGQEIKVFLFCPLLNRV